MRYVVERYEAKSYQELEQKLNKFNIGREIVSVYPTPEAWRAEEGILQFDVVYRM